MIPADDDAAGDSDGTFGDPGPASVPLDCALADKYRRRLRLLPSGHRAAYGDEMLEVFLAAARDADPENADLTYRLGSPGWKETWALVMLALRLRWTEPPAASRYELRAAGLRLFARIGLTLLAAWSLALTAGTVIFLLDPPADWMLLSRGVTPWQQMFPSNWWQFTQNWAHIGWLVALVLAASGRGRRLKWASVVAAIPIVVLIAEIVVNAVRIRGSLAWQSVGWVAVECAVVAGLAVRAERARVAEQVSAVPRGAAGAGARAPGAARVEGGAGPSYAVGLRRCGRLGDLCWAVAIAALWTGAVWLLVAWGPGNMAVYALAPLADEVGLWAVAALVVGLVVTIRRPAGRDPLAVGYAAAGLAVSAGLVQALGLPDWIRGAVADSSGAAAALVVCLVAMVAVLAVAVAALAVGYRRRSRGVS